MNVLTRRSGAVLHRSLASARAGHLPRSFSTAAQGFSYSPLFQSNVYNHVEEYKQLADSSAVDTKIIDGQEYLVVSPEAMTMLSEQAFGDIAHLLRPAHLQQLRNILDDPEASQNDHFVAMELLKNANIASGRILPGCQDTGTAIVMGKKGHRVLTDGNDEAYLSEGAYNAYTKLNLRYSQVAPIDMFTEKNTGNNMPAQIDLFASQGNEYKFQFIAKGGGSANKTFLYQQTKALLNEGALESFLEKNIKTIGTSACPPYHLAIVIGGLSAELTLKTVKLASTKFYDDLPTEGDAASGRAFRDTKWEDYILNMTRNLGIGAQFGGKYFCHDVRVIRLPRHGASCPVGMGVSCSADRQVLGKITKDGVYIEKLEEDVSKYLPEVTNDHLSEDVVKINMNDLTMDQLREELGKYPIRTRLSLTGTIVVARDIAHAKLLKRIQDGEGLPQYAKDHVSMQRRMQASI
jgi:fumarate hydratase, class I